MSMIYSHWGSVVSAGPAGVSSPCMSQSSAQTWWPLPLQSWWPRKGLPRSNALWESPGPQGWSGAASLRAELKENRSMKQVSIMFNPFKLVLILHIGAPLLLPLCATATSSFFYAILPPSSSRIPMGETWMMYLLSPMFPANTVGPWVAKPLVSSSMISWPVWRIYTKNTGLVYLHYKTSKKRNRQVCFF